MFTKIFRILSRVWTILFAAGTNHTHNDRRRCQNSAFLNLPVEIILMIQDLLPLASAVSLTITCRSLLDALGNASLRSLDLPANADQRSRFLSIMQREWLLEYQFCRPCSVFHPLEKDSDPHSIWWYRREPECAQISGCVFLSVFFRLRYQHAQLVMNRYRSGMLRDEDLNRLSYHLSYDLSYDHSYDLSYDLRGMHNGIHRRQVVTASIEEGALLIHMTSTLRLRDRCDVTTIKRWLHEVCHHVDSVRSVRLGQPQPLAATITCQLNNHDAKQQSCTDCCANWKSCPVCQTRFYVDVQRVRVHATTEIIVRLNTRKWLGPCESPLDPLWWRHCDDLPAIREEGRRHRLLIPEGGYLVFGDNGRGRAKIWMAEAPVTRLEAG
ncbi:MAG: hypothetical protein LQ341_004798 [Variospora aurantia]|nr:MAG: hypothetical protein LQ341_004798 [Variospora aurantia]